MTRQSAQQGHNRTGAVTAGARTEAMIQATREFGPSSPGDAQALAAVRVAYAHDGETFGEAPPPASMLDKARSAVSAMTGGQPTLLLDKLGERLAFEHAGARLYEALLSKHRAYGSFPDGPSADDLMHILEEEYEHADVLHEAIVGLGGDPTAVTPSANLAVNISAGLPQVLADPRTNLLQSLEAILVAELSDNECWTTLEGLARQAGHDDLAAEFLEAVENEREHLTKVRGWIAAGQRRPADGGGGADAPDASAAAASEAGSEFTFSDESPVDREGFVVSEEESGETPKPRGKRRRSS
jgi:Ferritin-like domain